MLLRASVILATLAALVALLCSGMVGRPGSCFGRARCYARGVTVSGEIALTTGVVVPDPAAAAPN